MAEQHKHQSHQTTLLEEIVEEVKNNSFSKILPNLQIAWDSTSLNALKKCPRYYQYSIILGYRGSGESADLKFGQLFHSALEIYDKARAQGKDHEEALISALRYAVVNTWDFELGRPWVSDIPTKTRNTLCRTIVWYLDTFKDENLKTLILANGQPAVELSFRFSLNDIGEDGSFRASTGEEFQLCGHLDKVVDWNSEILIRDAKTTKYELDDNYFRQYTPNNQVSLYSIAGIVVLNKEIDGLIIDGAQILVNGGRFRRRAIERSQAQLEEWLIDLRFYLTQAETYARNNHWPMNEQSCGYGNRQCIYRPICSTEPDMRNDLLDALFTKKTWDPLVPR